MAQLIGCPCVLVPEAGHISSLENPEFVTEVLLGFLAERQMIAACGSSHRKRVPM
jgi:pimeloyl-ACP methyl ester carboxylesterase